MEYECIDNLYKLEENNHWATKAIKKTQQYLRYCNIACLGKWWHQEFWKCSKSRVRDTQGYNLSACPARKLHSLLNFVKLKCIRIRCGWTEFIPSELREIKMHNFPLHHFSLVPFHIVLLVCFTFKISHVLASSHSISPPSI